MHISTIDITSTKERENNVEFSTSKITPIKVRGNSVDFSTIEITSKKYAEMTWKSVEIWSSMYQRNIHIESTWIRRGLPVWNHPIKSSSSHSNYQDQCLADQKYSWF